MNLSLSTLPESAGVYQYFDKDDKLLYVGKAKNLKKRIKSYFAKNANLSQRIAIMVSQIARIHTLITPNEQDALILENSLIKSLKPKYNILLRDDKTYPYIFIDKNKDFPTLEITRSVINKKNILYFGPFSFGARDLVDGILETTSLVQKKSCLQGKKACLFYQIKRCLAPCEGKISKQEYEKILNSALELLENKKKLIKLLESKMQIFAQNYAFEEAARLRDRIAKISQMQKHSVIDLAQSCDMDIFVFATRTQKTQIEAKAQKGAMQKGVLMKLFVRNGRISSSDFVLLHISAFDMVDSDSLKSAQSPHTQSTESSTTNHNLCSLYTQALLNHYKAHTPLLPDSILLPANIALEGKDELERILQERLGKKIEILQPKKGKKLELINLAHKNALELLHLHTNEENIQESRLLEQIATLFGLDEIPYRIEVFDTSHHSGAQCVGAMVVYENGEFRKDSYRQYNLSGSDEYAQMSELLTRRALDFENNPAPNLWLLDGGKAQLKLARQILESSGAQVDTLAISKHKLNGRAHRAKGSAQDILHAVQKSTQEPKEFKLSPNDKSLQFLQKLRDEAHRFAITFHRAQKNKNLTKLKTLTQTRALEPAQVDKLLRIYGEVRVIEKLSNEEITNALRKRG
ncbi:excinuclease ABC subunit UvrC [Helicobacter himalayensis]|uniref:excinuclease ABC subunit UvrC n=1 Tax=Helicobacter himalayensis TaxID=1591088 RepID=UPI003D6FF420